MKAAAIVASLLLAGVPARAADSADLLNRVRTQMSSFVKVFSDVRCTEQVEQDKLNKNGKIESSEKSTFDYLVIAQESGSDLSLQESRLQQQVTVKKTNEPMLVTNGFATFLLIFHPMYQDSFEFSPPQMETVGTQTLARIAFRHIRNQPSTAELVLRGREYPLEFAGNAWIDPASGSVVRIEAGLEQPMDDIGLRVMHVDVLYAPVHFRGVDDSLRLPAAATVEVETARQHWRNVHRFTNYQHFNVDVDSTVRAQP